MVIIDFDNNQRLIIIYLKKIHILRDEKGKLKKNPLKLYFTRR